MNRTMIFAVINQKGGAGKTTLAVHLACHLADSGARVAFVDGDPQQSGRAWMNGAAPDVTVLSPADGGEAHRQIAALDGQIDAIVCDGPPRLNDTTRVLMYMADRILIPVCPSTVDLRATLQAKQQLDLVQQARAADGVRPAWVRLVINRVRAQTELSRAVIAVMKGLDIPVARQTLGLRDAFARACTDDTVVTRMRKLKTAQQAADEIDALFTEVLSDADATRQAAA